MPSTRATPSISLDGALSVIETALAVAAGLQVAVCVAVCDPGGNTVAAVRMDGAPVLSMQLAQDKAWTVTQLNGIPTEAAWASVAEEPALRRALVARPRVTLLGGDTPLVVDGAVVGAIGVSGGSVDQDVTIAEAAADGLS